MNPRKRKLSYSFSLSTSATPSQQPFSSVNTETGAKEDSTNEDKGCSYRAGTGRSGRTHVHVGKDWHPKKGPSDTVSVRIPALRGGKIPCSHIVKILSDHSIAGMK